METGQRKQIISSVFFFFTGTILLLLRYFEILNPGKIILPSLVFVTGIIFLFLYLENKKETAFLYAGIFVSLSGLAIVFLHEKLSIFYFSDRIIQFFSGYWHFLLIAAGTLLLVNRIKK